MVSPTFRQKSARTEKNKGKSKKHLTNQEKFDKIKKRQQNDSLPVSKKKALTGKKMLFVRCRELSVGVRQSKESRIPPP